MRYRNGTGSGSCQWWAVVLTWLNFRVLQPGTVGVWALQPCVLAKFNGGKVYVDMLAEAPAEVQLVMTCHFLKNICLSFMICVKLTIFPRSHVVLLLIASLPPVASWRVIMYSAHSTSRSTPSDRVVSWLASESYQEKIEIHHSFWT
jgi:hypothetical protein